MNVQTAQIQPEMGELNASNALLGDQDALARAWERDGYWFFRDVLDKAVIAQIRQVYVDYLVELGVTDPGDRLARYNGGDRSALPANVNQTRLNDIKVHKLLHEAPTINLFFKQLFGCDPFWVPFTVHRTTPPAQDRDRGRFDFIHADGVYNDGLPFLICWVPLADIDEDVGGLALLEGVHKQPSLHTMEGMVINPIRLEDVPADRWRRAHYRAGDVLLMSLDTPHSGLSNVSQDRFRFSMDTRVMPATGKVPIVGTVCAVSAEGVTIKDMQTEHVLRFDDTSFVRGLRGDRMPLDQVSERYAPGAEVIIAYSGDVIVNMRPQT